MAERSTSAVTTARKPRLWLAAVDGVRLPPPPDVMVAAGGPESPLEVEFFGLTEAEQLRALRSFPGGSRFVLKPTGE